MQDDGQQAMGGGGLVPVNVVIDSVVRNAMDKLVEKQQQLRTGSQSRRRIELVRYLEETRRQFVSLLGLVQWQQKRLPITQKCENLIASLLHQRTHMKNTSERLCLAAETMAHVHRTPMYDVRTAVDVLASGTYRSLPSMDTHHFLPPKLASDSERDDVMKQLEFLTRTELLKIKMPPDFTRFEVKDGKLMVASEDEFELELSLCLDQPDRRWVVERAQILVRAEGSGAPEVEWLAGMVEQRMAGQAEPLVEAASVMADCLRFRTWQILKAQSLAPLSQPKVEIEAAPNGLSFTITYWQEVAGTTFEGLMTAAVRGSIPPERKLNISSGSDPRSRPPPPCLVFILSREGCARVQVRHYPRLVDDNGQLWEIPIKRSGLSLDGLLATTVRAHSRCRLRLLHARLQLAAPAIAPAGISVAMTPAKDEIKVLLDGQERLGIVVDTRSGDLHVRDVAAKWSSGGGPERLQQSLQRIIARHPDKGPGSGGGAGAGGVGAEGAGGDGEGGALVGWRERDMLHLIAKLAAPLGVPAASHLLTYSHVQAQMLSEALGEAPAMFLDVVACSLLDSGYKDASQPVPKAASQEVVTVVVTASAVARRYTFRLLVLPVAKNSKPLIRLLRPSPDHARADGSRKRPKTLPSASNSHPGEEWSAGEQLAAAIELAKAQVNQLKLQRQLDTQGIQYRDVDGTMLLRIPCAPLPTTEVRMVQVPRSRSALAGGVDAWGLHLLLSPPPVPQGVCSPEEVVGELSGAGTLEEAVRVRGGGLEILFPEVHAESVKDLLHVMQGLVAMARFTTALTALLNTHHAIQDFGVPPTANDAAFTAGGERAARLDLSSAVTLLGVGAMSAVIRLVASKEVVVFQYKPKRGFHITFHAAGASDAATRELVHPLLGTIQQALDTSMDVKGVLVALVRAEPILVALRGLAVAPGDLCLLPYTLAGFAILFRGCFGVHVRYALDDTEAYSISDVCPHPNQRPVPGPLEQGFMSHARHTAATLSATADSLWPIPQWRALIGAISEAANAAVTAEEGWERRVRAEEAAVGHYEAQRSSLVVGLGGLGAALSLLHAHLAAHHLLLLAHHHLAPPRWPGSKTSPVDKPTLAISKGKQVVTLEVSAPPADPRTPSKLELKVKVDPKGTTAPPAGAVADGDMLALQHLFNSTVAAAPYAPNRLRSFLHILSLPGLAIKSLLDLHAEAGKTGGLVELALAPMYLLPPAEAKHLPPPAGPAGLRSAPLSVAPRTDKACGITHDADKSELRFALRIWVCERPAVEVWLGWAFEAGKLHCSAIHMLGADGAAGELAASVAAALEPSKGGLADVKAGGALWAAIKGIVGAINVPPPAPLSI